MTKKILMGASVLAMLIALPAFAAEDAANNTKTSAKVEAKVDEAGEAIKDTANKAEAKMKETYSDVKAYFDEDKKDGEVISLSANSRIVAEELIGKTVEDASGKNLGKIKDILITKGGDAKTVVISDSAIGLGGTLAAFDYDVIQGISEDKDAVASLNEEQLKAGKRFEYKADEKAEGALVMPADQLSVAKILDSKVYDASGKAVADIETVAFMGNDADYIVVTFNKVLGVGGDKAALNLDALNIAQKDDKYNVTLTEQQSAQFESAKENAKAN